MHIFYVHTYLHAGILYNMQYITLQYKDFIVKSLDKSYGDGAESYLYIIY